MRKVMDVRRTRADGDQWMDARRQTSDGLVQGFFRLSVDAAMRRSMDFLRSVSSNVFRLKSVFALMLLLGAWAAEAKSYRDANGCTWYYQELNDDSAIIRNDGDNSMFQSAIDPNKAVGSLTIPEKIYDLKVVEIGTSALRDCNGMTSITIPSGIKTISENAFANCTELTSVTVLEGVETIGNRAFWGCTKLADVELPDTLQTIGEEAFTYESARCIGIALQKIRIPSGVTSIGKSAFRGCKNLSDIIFDVPQESVVGLTLGEFSFSGCTQLAKLVIPDHVTAVGASVFSGCTALTNLSFVATGQRSRTTIGDNAFQGCASLASATLSSNVVSIGKSAFHNCDSLQRLSWASGLCDIEENAFYGCASLSGELRFPPTLAKIGKNAFYECEGVTGLVFAENSQKGQTVSIGDGAFYGCGAVTNLYLSENVTEMGEAAFQGLSELVSVRLPPALSSLADSLFVACKKLKGIEFPETLQAIGAQTFYYDLQLRDFSIPSSVLSVGSGAFKSTGYWADQPDNAFVVKNGWLLGVKGACPADVIIGDNVRHIADGAFANAQTLTNLVIPATVKTVGANAFKDCTNFAVVAIDASVQLDDTAFYGSNWAPTEAGQGEFVDPTLPITNFRVEFHPNWPGTTENTVTQTFRVGIAKALLPNQFIRPIYEFDGWATNDTGKVFYADRQIVSNLTQTADEVVSLYAHWKAMTNLYTVAFKANGGKGTMSNQTFAVDQGQTLNTNCFIRSGFVFQGWALSATGKVECVDGQFVENLSTNKGMTVNLYARWDVLDGTIWTTQSETPVWYYMLDTTNTAVIINYADGQYRKAVDAPGMTSLVVPDKVGGVSVRGLGPNAFKGMTSLTNIVIPASVTEIDPSAFAGCTRLRSATMPLSSPLYEIMPDCYREIQRVTVPSVSDDFLEDEVELCECALSNCVALVSVTLPLGVKELPRSLLEDCASFVGFGTDGGGDMPYTVEKIDDRVFAGCTSLTALTVTERVAEIGANAFTGCSKLKIVRYLGDEPDAATGGSSGIYYKANQSLVSGYLRGLRNWPSVSEVEAEQREAAQEQAADDPDDTDVTSPSSSTNSVAATSNQTVTVIWPAGANGRKLLPWNTTKYQFKKVTFDYNNGASSTVSNRFYVVGHALMLDVDELEDLEDEDEDDLEEPTGSTGSQLDKGAFLGWYTARYGGEKVDPYKIVDQAMTLYAHWENDSSVERGSVETFELFYDEDDAGFSFFASTFDGLVMSDGAVAGTIRVKTQRGKYSVAAGGSNSVFTATIQVLGAKKATLKGSIDAEGHASAENEKKGLALELDFTQFGLAGTYETEDGSYEILGARNRYSAGSDTAKSLVWTALANARGQWNVVLPVESADGDGSSLAYGHAGLSVKIGSKGKTRISGTMPDGTRVAIGSTLIVGNGCCCLPVVVPLYAGKMGGFAFALWFTWTEDGSESHVNVAGLSRWDASKSAAAPFTATFGDPIVGMVSSGLSPGTWTFEMDGFFEDIGADDAFSPSGTDFEISGTRWKFPRADGVRFAKDEGWYVQEGREYGNPAGLKLKYTAKTGLFNGSFKVFSVTDEGRSKKHTATVTGGVVDGVGYGTATIKKIGSVPVVIE